MLISFVPKDVAKLGYCFIHQGETQTCKNCQFIQVCIEQLEIGSSYEVVDIRGKEHPCLIDNGIMIVCEVQKISDVIAIEKQKYLNNLITTRKPINCSEILCENYDFCVPIKYTESSKIKIIKSMKDINCPLGYNLVLVEASKVNE
ncbi:MAG: UPF0179 family protein [Candidatus Heimdallarchaeaceae archaeon]